MNLKKYILSLWNFWPPFLGSGIHIKKISNDYRRIEVQLKLRFWNSNYVGTQYGGSMFSMTDAFYMVMLLKNLGSEYIVWDKAATIRYLKPGKTAVKAIFELNQQTVDEIKNQVARDNKMDWHKTVQIRDINEEVVAEVDKIIYIRLKNRG